MKNVTTVQNTMPAAEKINTGNLLDLLMALVASNMSGDGQYTKDQINNQVKLTGVAIRVVELELKINKAMPHANVQTNYPNNI